MSASLVGSEMCIRDRSNIDVNLEKREAIEKESKYWLKVTEENLNLSNVILNWALYGTKPSAFSRTPPASLVILQVLRDIAKGYIPKEKENRDIPEEYLESLRRRYYWIYHLFYDWSIKIIKSINIDSHKLPKELEGVKLLEKKVKDKLKRKEELLDRASTLCINYGEGEKFTININFENLKRLQYSWGEKISLKGITPLNINLPIWYIIDGRDYLLLFPKSEEEKLKRLDEIKSINIMADYKEELKSKTNGKVEVDLELDIVSIEFELCDGTKISSRANLIVLEEVNKIQNKIEIWYDSEEVEEKLKKLVKSLIEERARRHR